VITGANDKILPTISSTATIDASTLPVSLSRLHTYSDSNPQVAPVFQDWGGGNTGIDRRIYQSPSSTGTVTVFHNDDNSSCGVTTRGVDESRLFATTGTASNLYGNFPKNTQSIINYTGSENIYFNNLGFDNILNWSQLNPIKLTVMNETGFGGGALDFDTTMLPKFTHFSNLQSVSLWGCQEFAFYEFTKTNFPNLTGAVFGFNADNFEAYDWSTFPDITKQLALQFEDTASSDLGIRNFYNTFEPTHIYNVSTYVEYNGNVTKPFIQIFGVNDANGIAKRDLLRARGWSCY
jgi:hypothetical protein